MSLRILSASPRLCERSPIYAACRLALFTLALITTATPLFAAEEKKAASPKPTNIPAPPAYAEPTDESDQYTVETLLTGLDNPCGVVIRNPIADGAPYEIFVAESGAGRILRVTSDKPSELIPAVTGIPVDSYGDAEKDEPEYRIGPLGMVFMTQTKLVVGTAGLPQGEDLIVVYSLPADGSPLAYDQQDHAVGPIPVGPKTTSGEGNYYGLAKTDDALFVTSNGDDDEAWVLKARITANKLFDLQPFIATKRLVGTTGPTAATVNPKKNSHYLVISQMADLEKERDSLITFYSPQSGKLAMNLQTGLYDISGLAYSPTDNLYAVDVVRADPALGGVYRIDAAQVEGRASCRAAKIASAERPTALAFGPDGAMYVTALGTRQAPDGEPTGVLLKITPKTDSAKF